MFEDSISFYKSTFPDLKFLKVKELIPFEVARITNNNLDDYVWFDRANSMVLSGSGEQGFLNKENLLEACHYYTVSKCHRPNDKDKSEWHTDEFNKAEYFFLAQNIVMAKGNLDTLVNLASRNFKRLGIENIIVPNSDYGLGDCQDIEQYDIFSSYKEVELGSYGIRYHKETDRMWVYGTICTDFRINKILGKETPLGYHIADIPKGELGEVSKITEEYTEFIDAVNQKSSVMELVELSDLVGAIESYVKKYNMTLEDLICMKNLTVRAFSSGKRG